MKKLFIVAVQFWITSALFSQNVHLNLFTGIANYKGDLQYNPKSGKQFTLKQPKFAVGAGIEYELSSKIYLRLAATLAKVHADDKRQVGQTQRNLNFTTPITDVMVGAEYYLFDPYTHIVTPYVFAGVNYFHFNPYTYDTAGTKVFLKPLSTEGQGFVDGRKPYNLSQLAIPFGGGLKFSLNDDVRVGVELGLRKLFTDYIDDVSTTYVDENLLLANRGQKAVDLAYRGDEVNAGPYPAEGTARGTLTAKDWYYFTGLTVSFRLGTGGGRTSGKKSKLGCPTSVR